MDRDPPARGRSRSRSPAARGRYSPPRDREFRRRSPGPRKPPHAPAPTPSNVLGVFGLSIRTTERDLEDEFTRFGRVEKVTIVYDQRSDRSRGFGFIKMSAVEEATRCIQELNGVDLNGRRIRVDYSVTERPHAPTPGEYMGHRRSSNYDSYSDRREPPRGSGRDRDYDRRDRDRRDDFGRDRERDREPGRDNRDRDFGRERPRDDRDNRDWRERRSPPPRRRSPSPPRRRRTHSRSPPPRGASPGRGREFNNPPPANGEGGSSGRW